MKSTSRFLYYGWVVLLLATAGSSPAADKAGDVVSLKGKATIERMKETFPAAKRTALQEADSVVTAKNARVKMLFRDDSVLTLGGNSRLSIKKYLYSPEDKRAESIYELADGKLRAVVGNATFNVTTPTAFAAARGTVFVMWFDAATNSTGIAVLEGELLVRNVNDAIAGTQTLLPGQVLFVPRDGPPGEPAPFTGQPGATGEAGPGEVTEESSVVTLPDPAGPGPAVFVEVGPGVVVAPVAPPLEQIPPADQVPVSNATTVNLNLNFQ